MRKNAFLTAGFVVTNFINSFLLAQDSNLTTSVVRWDLATAIAYAKQNNIQVNLIRLNEQLSQQDLLLARAARYPNLSGSATQSFKRRPNSIQLRR